MADRIMGTWHIGVKRIWLISIQCAAALFRHRAISQEAGATERAPEADGRGRIALTPELQKGSLHNVFGSRPVTAGSEAF